MPDPIMKILVDVQNSEKVKELTAEVQKQEKAIAALNTQLTKGTINQQQFTAAATPMAQKIGAANAQLHELHVASGSAGRGLSQLSYAVDDIQYGFNAIVNNIPQIVMGLGGSAGIAGAVGIAAVAINQLIKHWADLTAAMQAAWEGGSAERLKVLAERAEEAAKAFEKLAKAPTKFEEKGGEKFKEAVIEGPTEHIRKAITDTLLALGQGATLGKFNEGGGVGVGPGVIPAPGKTKKEAEKEQYEATAKMAADLIGQVQQGGVAGQTARDHINRLMKANPGAFSDEFKKQFAESDPAKIKADEAEKKAEKERAEAAKIQHQSDEADKFIEHEQKRIDKEVADEKRKIIREEAEEAHRARMQKLEDRQEAAHDQRKKIEEEFKNGRNSQVMQGGAKAAIDLYQSSVGGKDNQVKIALLKASDKKLKEIHDELKKERRVVLPK